MVAKKKYLFIPLTGPGYLFPSIRLAHILEKRSADVAFATSIDYRLMLQTNGLTNIGIRNDQVSFLNTENWFSSEKAPNEVRILGQIIEQYRPDVIVTSSLVLASFVLAERYHIPLVILGFTEYLYPGPNGENPEKEWRLQSITDYYNRYRAAISLPPVGYDPATSPLIGNKYLLRCVPQLTGNDKYPDQVRYIGPLYWEPDYINVTLSRFISNSRSTGIPVVYIQIGKLFQDREIWQKIVALLGTFKVNFVADIGRGDYLTSANNLPPNFYANSFIPLGKIASDIDFVICSGQSTTVVSAIVHGKQILSIPHSADSVELTKRLESLGLAIGVYDKNELIREVLIGYFDRLFNKQILAETLRYRRFFEAFTDDMIFETIAG